MFSVTKSEIRSTDGRRTCFSVLLCSAGATTELSVSNICLSLSLPVIFVFPRFSAAERFTEFECKIRRLGKRLQNGFQSSMATQSALSLFLTHAPTLASTYSLMHTRTHAHTHSLMHTRTHAHTCRLIEAGGHFMAAAMGSEQRQQEQQRTYLKFLGPNLKRATTSTTSN